MRIGLQTSTLDKSGYGRWGDDAYLKLKEHGYSCSDFNMADTDSPLYSLPREDSDAILLRERELAAKAGIEIVQVHGPWRYPPRDASPENRMERLEKMKLSIRAASLLGCKNWVIHPIMPFGLEDARSGDARKTWDLNLLFMRELLKTAHEYDVTICLENMPMQYFSLSRPEDIVRFVRTIGDDHFKICLDTGHVAVFSDLSVGDEARRLGSEIRALHVHDNKYGIDAHMMPFFGIIDWQDFADALKEIGFDGVFSLETLTSSKLPTPLFEEMGKCLGQIAHHIVAE